MDVYLSGNIHIFHILEVHSFNIFFRSSIIKFESVMRKKTNKIVIVTSQESCISWS